MKLARYVKDPDERKRYSIDYSNWLDASETIALVSFSATPVTSPPLLADSNVVNGAGTGVTFFVSGGLAGATYDLEVQITTSGGQIKQDQITFTAREV